MFNVSLIFETDESGLVVESLRSKGHECAYRPHGQVETNFALNYSGTLPADHFIHKLRQRLLDGLLHESTFRQIGVVGKGLWSMPSVRAADVDIWTSMLGNRSTMLAMRTPGSTLAQLEVQLAAFHVVAMKFMAAMQINALTESAIDMIINDHNYPAAIAKLRRVLQTVEGLKCAPMEWQMMLDR
jgi:hypothetical protein